MDALEEELLPQQPAVAAAAVASRRRSGRLGSIDELQRHADGSPQPAELAQDERLPAHKRRIGRIGSLREFQQRALDYEEARGSPPPPLPPHRPGGADFSLAAFAAGTAAADADSSPSPPSPETNTAIDIRELLRFSRGNSSGASRSADSDSDYHLFDHLRKPIMRSQRSRSVGSLFGGARYKPKSFAEFYGRQVKVLSFLVLLGVIGGPLGYGMRRYIQDQS